MLELYGMLRKGFLNTGDNFVIPLDFSNHDVAVNVSGGMSAAGQTMPLTSKLGDVPDSGKYLQIMLVALRRSI